MKPYSFFILVVVLLLSSHTICSVRIVILNETTDQDALVAFKTTITSDPNQFLTNNWSTDASACNWIGVSCGIKHRRVVALNFSGFGFEGTIVPNLGNLTFLRSLDLSHNNFTGSIPHELSKLRRLKVIRMGSNSLTGEIPSWLGTLGELESIRLNNNTFSGGIPPSLGNNSKLRVLNLAYNSLGGNIPQEIGNLSSLEILDLQFNGQITGSIPDGIFNLSSIGAISLTGNSLSGRLPNSMCNNIPKLKGLHLSNNLLSGQIPFDIYNCSELQTLSLSANHFNGSIPRSIGWLTELQGLYLSVNNFQGGIPSDLRNLSCLQVLSIRGVSLTGQIPSFIFNVSSLVWVDFGNNSLSGSLPVAMFRNLPNNNDLLALSLSANMLNGSLPAEIGNLSAITDLDLSRNHFSVDIPSSIDRAESLVYLSLAHNKFEGSIPQSMGNLKGLESLDLSYNNFSGFIPKPLEGLRYLQNFNVSYNRLEGQIPTEGNFANFTAQSFLENYNLCGATRLQVPPCGKSHKKTRSKNVVSLMKYIILPCLSAIIVVIVILLLIKRRKSRTQPPNNETLILPSWRASSYLELQRATNAFSESNLLGSGSFGSVYIGTLLDGLTVAIKVFNLQCEKVARSFDTEIEVLRGIRHRNLIKIIGCCVSADFKALVYEFMPNGSLEKWLYSHNCFLDLLQRLNIAIDVALALEYLHVGLTSPIVHCDLKPSNVLLDRDMTAHVGDFGIAKIIGQEELMTRTKTLATIGYMAPEYGGQGIVSTGADVYSFGIILLELCTRKMPTDEMFGEEMNLKRWVSLSLHENTIINVVDTNLFGEEDRNFSAKAQCLLSILSLTMECLAISPSDRIKISEVVAKLRKIKTMFLANSNN